MSNQFLKLRRSAVPGKVPTTSSLDFGEIALNTYDGLAFMKKSGSNGEEIVTIGSTVGAFTGSFSGSFTGLFTGSLFGTSSWANNATTSSYALNAASASYALNSTSASHALTSSFTTRGIGSFTGSFSGSLANLQGTLFHIPYFSSSQVLADSTMFQVDNGGGAFSIAINQNGVSGLAPEALFVYQPSPTSYNVVSGKGNLNNYLQLNIQNENNGDNASSDIVATANNGNESTNYIDMGINGANYTGFLGGPNDAYIYSTGSNFHIGNINPDTHLGFFVGGDDVMGYSKLQLNPNNLHEMTGSLDISGSLIAKNITSSLFGTASWAQNALTSSYILNAASASFASTASSADNFLVRGTLTAQTIVAQVITASTEFITGSTKFGSIVSNTHQFTGSVSISGSLNVNGAGITGSLFGTSSWSNNAITASYILNAISASFATSASQAITASYVRNAISASIATSSSYAVSASIAQNAVTASYVANASSFPYTGSAVITGSLTVTGSVNVSGSTGTILSANVDTIAFTGSFAQSGSLTISGSINATNGITGSLLGTASWAQNAISASFASTASFINTAQTASYVLQAVSASFATQAANATTASYVLNAVSASYASGSTSASFAATAALAPNYMLISATSSMLSPYVLTSQTSSMSVSSASYSTYAVTSSLPLQGVITASAINTTITFIKGDGSSFDVTVSQSGSVATSSYALFAETASYFGGSVVSSSYASSSTSASFAATAALAPLYVPTLVTASMLSPYILSSQTSSMSVLSASYASGSTSASFAATAALAPNYVLNSVTSSMLAPYVLTSQTSSMAVLSASYASGSTSASYAFQATNASTASYILQAVSASYASSSTSASFASTASLAPLYVLNSVTASMLAPYVLTSQTSSMSVLSASYASGSTSASFALTASFIKNAQTSSYILQAVSASYASGSTSASYASASTSASYALTASYLLNAVSSSFASTASSADDLLVRGTLTAQTIVVQTITASQEYITGSSKFGSIITNTHQFTGSVSVSGSITVTNGVINNLTASNASNAITASYALVATSASYASASTSASYASTSSYAANAELLDGKDSTIFATTGSNTFIGNQTITGSLTLSGSVHNIAGIISASNTLYVGVTQPTLALDTRGRILYSNFFSTTASLPSASEYHGMFVHVHSEGAAYYSHGSNGWVKLWDRFNDPGLISGSQVPFYITGQAISPLSISASSWITASSFYGDGSGITNAISAQTASYVNPLNQTVIITGSLITSGSNTLIGNTQLTGSIGVSGSQTFIGTNTITGSVNITGSTTQIGNNNLFGDTTISGSLIVSGSKTGGSNPSINVYGGVNLDGYLRFDPVDTNLTSSISASYIYVSGSTNDLYFTQNGQGYSNTTRLRWLEGNLYTGLLNGGLITIQTGSTYFNLSSGSGIIVNLNASISDNPYPTIKYVNWGNFISQSITYLTSSIQSYIGIDSNGQITQQTTPFIDGEYNTKISIGTVLHQNKSTVNASITYPNVAYGYKQRTYDFIKAFGPLKLSGYTIIPSSSLGLTIGGGTAFADGRNYQTDPNNPSYITDAGTAVSKIFRYYQSGSEFVQDTNGGLGYTVIDPANYNPGGSGSLTPVSPATPFTIQRVFYYPNSATKGIVVYYGTNQYASIADAATNINYESFNEVENTKQNAVYLGAVVVRYNGEFTNPVDYSILPAGIFRSVGGSGGGGSVVTTRLVDLSDVAISGPTSGQALVYDSATSKWSNKSYISASISGNAVTATSASYATTASFLTGTVTNATSASYATTASYAILAQTANTASYVVTAQTASYVLQAVSASYANNATSASYANNTTSASFAQTASYVANINKKVRTQIPIMATQGQTTYITNFPAADDEVGTELRIKENLLLASSCSLSARVEVATGGLIGFLKVQYSTDESTWNDFHTNKIDLGTAGTQLTVEEAIPSGAKTTGTYLRLVTSDGTGTGDSNTRFGNVTLNIIYDL